ncbi:MAG: hypothetical protein Q7J24_06300 [Desulfomicrobium sp.]|nr:hypothetical protein [Desulfomicrobium sp.]
MTTNELRSNLAQAELQAVHASLTALTEHVAYWTPEKVTAEPDAAYKGLDLVSISMTHISERVDRIMDMVKPENPKE